MFYGERLRLRMRDTRNTRVVSVLVGPKETGGNDVVELKLLKFGETERKVMEEAASRLRQRVVGDPEGIDASVAWSTLQRNGRLDV